MARRELLTPTERVQLFAFWSQFAKRDETRREHLQELRCWRRCAKDE
jgi:hypothetical protein